MKSDLKLAPEIKALMCSLNLFILLYWPWIFISLKRAKPHVFLKHHFFFFFSQMKFFYRFFNLLGSVYNNGDLAFTPDGFTLLSPVGNRVIFHELRNNQRKAMPVETDFNFGHLSISPNGRLLLASTENTYVYLISLMTGSILYHKNFKHISNTINCLSFSPNGTYYAICADNAALIYITPGNGKYFLFFSFSCYFAYPNVFFCRI